LCESDRFPIGAIERKQNWVVVAVLIVYHCCCWRCGVTYVSMSSTWRYGTCWPLATDRLGTHTHQTTRLAATNVLSSAQNMTLCYIKLV